MLDDKDEVYRAIAFDIAKARAAFDREIEDHLEELAYEDGFEDSEESGIQKERYQIISAMFKNGVNINDISATTNLSIEEVTKVLGE